jgi:hypothetical protein
MPKNIIVFDKKKDINFEKGIITNGLKDLNKHLDIVLIAIKR